MLSGAATVLILFASLGGISWRWGSRQSVGLALGGIVLTLLFLLVEHRAKEPVIPLKLFRERVFQASSSIGFVMGFAMFGAVTFIPLFLQDVKNVSPTLSGLRLFPLMFGLFGASIISGRLVTRWGRYKVFPILGTACMTVGAYLLSLIGIDTSALLTAVYMFVFGVGLGLIQQVLVVAVQNAVSYEELGVATSGATFFRMIGGSFGTAVFGAIYANVLTHKLTPHSPGGRRSIWRRWIRACCTSWPVRFPRCTTRSSPASPARCRPSSWSQSPSRRWPSS
jgi:predicted MFS family arabinose efflux permease